MVYITGAGCGDPKLLTLRGVEVLESADVIVYDALIDKSLLELAPKAKRIYVGKRNKNHTLNQDEINALLVDLSKEYENIVRLKGGDPYVFGRGGEEGEYLKKNGISFEVIPGISSVIGGLSYAGIPITHRDYSSSFTILTGNRKDRSDDYDYTNLAHFDGTLVFVMGASKKKEIARRLIEGGKDPKTPTAIITNASLPSQKTTIMTLEELEKLKFNSPALIVIGNVVTLSPVLNTFEKSSPLYGKRILVTRAKTQSTAFSKILREHKALPVEMAAIEIIPNKVELKRLEQAIRNIQNYNHLIFTSINAVKIFFNCLSQTGQDVRALSGLTIFAMGSGTARELSNYGIRADVIPQSYITESLVEKIKEYVKKDDRILLPRSGEARDLLVNELQKVAEVEEIKIYTVKEDLKKSEIVREMFNQRELDAVTFLSSSTVKHFAKAFSPEETKGTDIFSIGPQTSKTLRELGFVVTAEAKEYSITGLMECMENYYEEKCITNATKKE